MAQALTDLKNADQDFFHAVVRDPAFADVIARLGFDPPYVGLSQYNAVFIISKPAWTLPQPAGHARTINIHFEAKDRREIRLEVGPDPWIASLDRKPAEKAALAPVLARKARIIRALRTRLIGAPDVPSHFGANATRLLDPSATASHGAVRLLWGSNNPTVEKAAHWFAVVIETVTPLIDEVAARHREG